MSIEMEIMSNAMPLMIALWFFGSGLYLFVNSIQISDDLYLHLLFVFSFEIIVTS